MKKLHNAIIVTCILLLLLTQSVSAYTSPIMMVMQPEHYPLINGSLCERQERDTGLRVLTITIQSAHAQYEGDASIYLLAKEGEFTPEVQILLAESVRLTSDIITTTYQIPTYWSNEIGVDVKWDDNFPSDLYVSGVAWIGECPQPRNEEETDEPSHTFFVYMPSIMR